MLNPSIVSMLAGCRKLIRSLTVLLAFFTVSPVFSAQVIKSLPATLTNNWQVCVNYQDTTAALAEAQCNIQESTRIAQPFKELVASTSYTKEFIIGSQISGNILGLSLGEIDDVDEVKINGHLIGSTGRFPPDFDSAFRFNRLYVIPANIVKINQFNRLTIKTFSSVNQPSMQHSPVIIDDYFQLAHHQQEFDYLFVWAIAILILLAGFQVFYYLVVSKNSEIIYLAIYLISFAIVSFSRSLAPLHIGIDLSMMFRTESLMLAVGLIALSFFMFRIFDLEVRPIYRVGILSMAIPALATFVYSNPLYSRTFAEFSYWVICIAGFLTGGSGIVIALSKKRQYSLRLLIVMTASWLALCFDCYSQSNSILNVDIPYQPYILILTAVAVGIFLHLLVTHKHWQYFQNASFDHLTGTLLRPAFFQRLSEEVQRSKNLPSSIVVGAIDIHQLKAIESSYGRVVSNEFLVNISEAIAAQLKPFDLVSHFSDDEFYIAATVESREEANNYLQAIQKSVSQIKVTVKNSEIIFDTKVGGVIYNPDQHLSISQVIQDTNYCLAKIKSSSRSDFLLLNNPTVTA